MKRKHLWGNCRIIENIFLLCDGSTRFKQLDIRKELMLIYGFREIKIFNATTIGSLIFPWMVIMILREQTYVGFGKMRSKFFDKKSFA